ncbi:serine/threonine-protein kinase [Streptomyces sp. XD-27]|uniref:serine/threonine-protein kinase n=1 Tax=Streptomyces sp. XD-27 TaxID=3062779 RepID=UPI0026F43AFC|nr:serine/threonine protein kinase [Streptomyces sp. XD-27]WKX71364.1 protein kinase [Streptomyces sp. XD-27]
MNSQQNWPDPPASPGGAATPPPPTVPPTAAGSAPAAAAVPDAAHGVFSPLAPDDPRSVAGYQIRAKLGAGGMGKVYLSYTPGGRAVAIKVIRPDFAQDPEFRRRFTQEVEAAQRVQGLFTAPVIDRDTDGPNPWLATAYIPGPSLHAAVAEFGPLPVPTVVLLVAGMAEALQVIHGAGIVHRDLKPANVLLASDGPRVIDFGIARAADATSLTASGVTVGSPAFMAPEQASGTGCSPATDVFALGQVAAYAATGTPPFGEGTSTAVLYRIVHEEPDLSRVPHELRELVSRCLAKAPEDRPGIAEIIAMCSAASAQTSLRRPEDWVPGAVAADITRRTNAPVPQPPPSTAPVGPTPTAPDIAPPPAGHATPPAAVPSTAVPLTAVPSTAVPSTAAQPGAFGAAGGAFTGYQPAQAPQPGPAPYPPAASAMPQPGAVAPGPPPKRRPGPILAGAIALVLVTAGATAFAMTRLKDDDTANAQQADGGGPKEKGEGKEQSPGDKPADDASESPAPTPQPTADTYKGVNLPEGYSLEFSDDPVRPISGIGHDIGYCTYAGGAADLCTDFTQTVLLDPGQKGSHEVCSSDTRYGTRVPLSKFSAGRQVCLTTQDGVLAMLTMRGKAPAGSTSDYITLDVTVWR